VVTLCTTRFDIHKLHFLPTQCIYVFCVDLRTNSDYFTVQHELTGFYNRDGVCLLRGTFCPHSVFVCFVWIWEQTAIISLYSINWLIFITETECVYCAVRTGCLCIMTVVFSFQRFKHNRFYSCNYGSFVSVLQTATSLTFLALYLPLLYFHLLSLNFLSSSFTHLFCFAFFSRPKEQASSSRSVAPTGPLKTLYWPGLPYVTYRTRASGFYETSKRIHVTRCHFHCRENWRFHTDMVRNK
jgi:hypothetical protein